MHRLALAAALAATLTLTGSTVAAASPQHHRPPQPDYYLSLGDSLSQGVQPNAQGQSLPTDQGFTDQLYAMLRWRDPAIRVQKLGCPGETTTTVLDGGICGYSGGNLVSYTADTGSQLAAAETFLAEHRGHVPLITIDIGANNILPCLTQSSLSAIETCLEQAFPVVQRQLTTIMSKLTAADPHATIVGMTYYDVSLASWLTGSAGQAFATESLTLASEFRSLLIGVYRAAGARIADVYSSFRTPDMTDQINVPGIGTVPEDVGLLCEWTWMCTPAPQGPNVHANATGYGVIARTFYAALWQGR